MTKTRMIAIMVAIMMLLSQVVVFADSGLVEVEVGVNDSKVFFNNHVMGNDELAFPFIKYNDIIYYPLAWNSMKSIGFKPVYEGDSITLLPIGDDAKLNLDEKPTAVGQKKAEVKSVRVKIGSEALASGEYPILKYNNMLYLPLTWNVLNQLGLFYSSDDQGDLHISSFSKKALDQSVNKANEAYVAKLVKFVRSVNHSLSEGDAQKYVKTILKECDTYDVDETWIISMIWQESKFNATCEYKGAVGIMQILVSTGKNFGLTKQDLLTPEKSIKAGVQYIKSGYDRFGSFEKAVLAYNQGSYRVEKGNYSTWYLDDIKEKRAILLKKIGE